MPHKDICNTELCRKKGNPEADALCYNKSEAYHSFYRLHAGTPTQDGSVQSICGAVFFFIAKHKTPQTLTCGSFLEGVPASCLTGIEYEKFLHCCSVWLYEDGL